MKTISINLKKVVNFIKIRDLSYKTFYSNAKIYKISVWDHFIMIEKYENKLNQTNKFNIYLK